MKIVKIALIAIPVVMTLAAFVASTPAVAAPFHVTSVGAVSAASDNQSNSYRHHHHHHRRHGIGVNIRL